MTDWKLRQKIYHSIYFGQDTTADVGDNLSNYEIVEEWSKALIISRALEYPIKQSPVLYYPAKSFAVAIIYALLLQKHFNVDLIEALEDSMLLYGNDPYFKRYSDAQDIYDLILKDFPLNSINTPAAYSENFQNTCNYFLLEFLIHEETCIYAASN